MSTLQKRFESFVRTLDGFEHIDALLKDSNNLDGKQRADYLFQGRQIIVEQKTLLSNPIGRPQKFADRIMHDRGIVTYGTVSTRWRIFSSQPDAISLRRGLVLSIAKNIEAVVAKADDQTRDTRLIFDIPDAVGILVLLNEKATMLTPEIIGYALSETFQRQDKKGAPQYKHIDAVIGISEVHTVPVPGALRTYPINTFISPHTNSAAIVDAFADMLISRWAAFNHAPLTIKESRN